MRIWSKMKNYKAEPNVMRDGTHKGAITPQEYLLEKMRDDFDRAKECVNFIDRLRNKKNG